LAHSVGKTHIFTGVFEPKLAQKCQNWPCFLAKLGNFSIAKSKIRIAVSLFSWIDNDPQLW
jgi:hypothetical protein